MLYWNEEADQFVRIDPEIEVSEDLAIAGAPEMVFETDHELI